MRETKWSMVMKKKITFLRFLTKHHDLFINNNYKDPIWRGQWRS